MPARRDPQWTGIQPHGAGYRAEVSRGYGRTPLRRHFPAGTDPRTMQAWRKDAKASLRLKRKARAYAGTFAHDARVYLTAVQALTTYADRQREIALWVEVFGQTPRDEIRAVDIRAVRDRWLTQPRSRTDKRPVSAGTVNKRLRALSNLWTVLDGPRAPNPVREVPEAPEPRPLIRAVDYQTIEQILAAMPDRGKTQKGKHRPTVSLSKLRLRVLAYTGWPTSTLGKLTRADVDLEHGIVRLPARQKGKGADAVIVPLVPDAVAALKALDAVNGWGTFSHHSLSAAWRRAAKACGYPGLRVYDLRHSFLTHLAAASRDERAVQAIAQHGDIRTTRRYTLGSVSGRVAAAMDSWVEKKG